MILDGRRLAREREADHAARARALAERRGYPPRLALVAFGDERGTAPHIGQKVRACAAVGVEALPLVLPPRLATGQARQALARHLEAISLDGLFLQFPFPAGIDGEALSEAIPEALDVDVMSPGGIRRFLAEADALPPVTVSAGLALLDAHPLPIAGLRGLVVAEPSPFAVMFREALVRRGARLPPLLSPDAADLAARVGEAELVVVAAARPGLVRARDLAPGAIAIDVGYFNEGGRGDIDLSGGWAHLAALAPVPGGIGPMTVSCLLERVLHFAERGGRRADP